MKESDTFVGGDIVQKASEFPSKNEPDVARVNAYVKRDQQFHPNWTQTRCQSAGSRVAKEFVCTVFDAARSCSNAISR